MKYFRTALATVVFAFVYIAIYVVHVTFFPVNVVLYSALFDGILAVVLSSTIFIFYPYFSLFNAFEKTLVPLIWFLIAYATAISVPTVIDRSLSFYLLEKLDQRGGGILQSKLELVFTQEYIKEHRLVDIRLTEQLQSGTIVIEGGCVKLTPWGRNLSKFSRFFRKHLLPGKRLIMGSYGDSLTDPFRTGLPERADYRC
ncbi:MAG: hypothetical protein ACJAYC_002333 [Halieaceae bacterium]|jgi:hypothetical protein